MRSASGELVMVTPSASSHSNQPAIPCSVPSRSMRKVAVQRRNSGLSAQRSISPRRTGGPSNASRGSSIECLVFAAWWRSQWNSGGTACAANGRPSCARYSIRPRRFRGGCGVESCGRRVQKSAPRILHGMRDAVVEAEVADVIADHHVDRLGQRRPVRCVRE